MKKKYDDEYGKIKSIMYSQQGYPAYIYTETGAVITTSPVEVIFRTACSGYVYLETKNTIYEVGKYFKEKPYRFFIKALEPVVVGKSALVVEEDGWQVLTSKVISVHGDHFETQNSIYYFDRKVS